VQYVTVHLISCGNRLHANITVSTDGITYCYLALDQHYSNYLQFNYRKTPNILIHTLLYIIQIVILTC